MDPTISTVIPEPTAAVAPSRGHRQPDEPGNFGNPHPVEVRLVRVDEQQF